MGGWAGSTLMGYYHFTITAVIGGEERYVSLGAPGRGRRTYYFEGRSLGHYVCTFRSSASGALAGAALRVVTVSRYSTLVPI